MHADATIIDPTLGGHNATLDSYLIVVALGFAPNIGRPYVVRVTTSDRRAEYEAKKAELLRNPFLRSGVTNFGTPRLLANQAA